MTGNTAVFYSGQVCLKQSPFEAGRGGGTGKASKLPSLKYVICWHVSYYSWCCGKLWKLLGRASTLAIITMAGSTGLPYHLDLATPLSPSRQYKDNWHQGPCASSQFTWRPQRSRAKLCKSLIYLTFLVSPLGCKSHEGEECSLFCLLVYLQHLG